jgi:hypothetical protein
VRHIISGVPDWFPYGVPVSDPWQIPRIAPPVFTTPPTAATAFDKRGQVDDPANTLLHCYVKDDKLRSQLTDPRQFPARFAGYWGIVPPDFSIRAQDPPDLRILAVRMSRAVGAFYQAHGLRVVPNIRWGDPRDYGHAFEGVETGSAVSVSNHGCWRDRRLRQGFLLGFHEMIDRLAPSTVFLHGTADPLILRQLRANTSLIHFPPDRTRARTQAA